MNLRIIQMSKNKILILFILICVFIVSTPTVEAGENKASKPDVDLLTEKIEVDTLESVGDTPDVLPWNSLENYNDILSDGNILRLAVVLSDIYSKKDMEFMRGLLYGIDQAGLPKESISLKVINGEIPADSLEYELEYPHIILSTNEKEVPRSLIEFADENDVWLVNVFDPKSNDYLTHPTLYQLFTPSNIFSTNAANYFKDNFSDNSLVIIGTPDPSDMILQDLILSWPEEYLYVISKEELPTFLMDEGSNYLFYPSTTSHDEVKSILEDTLKLMVDNPITGVRIIGRPNWVMYGNFSNMLSNLEVFIPVKCYFDSTAPMSKRFLSGYKSKFGQTPLKSYPVYAAMGYDVARHFLPKIIINDITDHRIESDKLQIFMDFAKESQGGYYNKGAYILHFEPWGTMQKELIH